jgi:hypothetical protein
MESCRNLASEALGIRALGIVHSAAQQPGFLIAIDSDLYPSSSDCTYIPIHNTYGKPKHPTSF